MSQRDLLWFLAGAALSCIVGAVMTFVVFSLNQPDGEHAQASLPPWHPPTQMAPAPAGADLHVMASQARRQRNYGAAQEAYAELEKQNALTADEWADYADVVASAQNGALAGEPARLLHAALKANPAHPKALWLRASLAHQQASYEEALDWWQRLQQQIPADSPDQRIISANIDEARRLMTGGSKSRDPAAQPAPELDLRLGRALP